MKWKGIFFILPTLLFFISCDKDTEETTIPGDVNNSPTATTLRIEALENELFPLTTNPLSWSDEELTFLDPLAAKPIIALGEATHGTSEFFTAKFRIFKYLVENHDFKLFAFEADFGESILINDAIQRSATNEIEDLMKSKMIFWTWRTEEVRQLLEWMSEYNRGRPEEEKIHYVGFDCQFNEYHPDMVKDYLSTVGAPFLSSATSVLNEAESASRANFESYDQDTFNNYLESLDSLIDSMDSIASDLIAASSEREFLLNKRLVRVIRQVSEVIYANTTQDFTLNYRDLYMAENVSWFNEYFNGAKMALWAHNAHVSNDPTLLGGGGAMGRHLTQDFGNDYISIAFLFSRGSFTARSFNGSDVGDLARQELNIAPKRNSLNFYMNASNESVFSINMDLLQAYDVWMEAYTEGLEYFHIGAFYNNEPTSYYLTYNPIFFDYIIYFDNTTASIPL